MKGLPPFEMEEEGDVPGPNLLGDIRLCTYEGDHPFRSRGFFQEHVDIFQRGF
jgi:hypothetical protein